MADEHGLVHHVTGAVSDVAAIAGYMVDAQLDLATAVSQGAVATLVAQPATLSITFRTRNLAPEPLASLMDCM